MVSIRLSESVEKRLTKAAERAGKTKASCAREAILKYLPDMEDVYEAECVWEHIGSGKEKTVPLEDVMKRFGFK